MAKTFLVPWVLPADPANALEAATKQYVDAAAGATGTKITDLTALTPGAALAAGDLTEVVDISDTTMAATGTNKKTTMSDLRSWLAERCRSVLRIRLRHHNDLGTSGHQAADQQRHPCLGHHRLRHLHVQGRGRPEDPLAGRDSR